MRMTRDMSAGSMAAPPARRSVYARRAIILPLMLVILLLLALLTASYAFQIQADYSAGRGLGNRLQTRLAAEAGIQKVMQILRTDRDNQDAWYHNPEVFDQALVWKPDALPEELGRNNLDDQEQSELPAGPDRLAYRFSVVADFPNSADTENTLAEAQIRFGITDEASKLNINVATEEQLLRLIEPVVQNLDEEAEGKAQELVAALLDWRDADADMRTNGAEAEYYATLNPPYRPKNAEFETVEELLMVKGFTGRILYGEDYDRNGLMTQNEDDGEQVFPNDNGDGVLERGIYPYITVWSHDTNTASDNQPRVNLFGPKDHVAEKLAEIFDRQEVIDWLLATSKKGGPDGIKSLADYLTPKVINNTSTESPLSAGEIETLFDMCTINPEQTSRGQININTARSPVLRAIGFTDDEIVEILEMRQTLLPAARQTPAWLASKKVLAPERFAEFQFMLTGRGRQFTIESIGFADHHGQFTRLHAVVDMRGPMAQIIYARDITKLGLAYPLRGQEGERRFVLDAE